MGSKSNQAAAAAAPRSKPRPPRNVKRVRATARGFYHSRLIRPGMVFDLTASEHFSAKWMEPVPSDTPVTPTQGGGAADHAKRVAAAVPPRPKTIEDVGGTPAGGPTDGQAPTGDQQVLGE